MNNEQWYITQQKAIEVRLSEVCGKSAAPQEPLTAAMRYSVLAGGKRIRPVLALAFCSACGAQAESALNFGCALELLHTYSLIHDDLPCMDNDELRRGKPTNHKVYGEWMALLAGDALQAEAFYTIACSGLRSEQIAEATKVLAYAAGQRGICGGQYLDLEGEGKQLSEAELFLTHSMKTAALIEAACEMGCIAAEATEQQRVAAKCYGQALGLAFQIRDDILDCEGQIETLGKTPGKDEKSRKFTFVNLFGLDKCCKLVEENTQKAIDTVAAGFDSPDFLIWLADKLAKRNG